MRELISIALTLTTVLPLGVLAEDSSQRSRAEFAAAFAKLKEGMSAEKVEKLLGKPDDIRTRFDVGGISMTHSSEVWCYGTHGHMTFPTLGSIYIDDRQRLQYWYGTSGAAEIAQKLRPGELDKLLLLLANVTGISRHYNPRTVIQAVNALQPLGKETGCAVIREYVRLAPEECWWQNDSDIGDKYSLFLVIRTLFEVPAQDDERIPEEPEDIFTVVRRGYLRPPGLGAPAWEPADLKEVPRFPIHLVNDVPLLVNGGYRLAGLPEGVLTHLDRLEQKGIWRKTLLTPPENPLTIEAPLSISQHLGKHGTMAIEEELLRLIDTVYRPPATESPSLINAVNVLEKTPIVWNAETNQYTLKDGTFLPPMKRKLYRREIFEPKLPHSSVQAILERQSDDRVHLLLPCQFETAHPKAFTIRVNEVIDGKERLLVSLQGLTEGGGGNSWGSENSTSFALKEGQTVRLICDQEGKLQESEILKP